MNGIFFEEKEAPGKATPARQYDLARATYGEVKQIAGYDMAILPWGATEPHNGHLPYCTDVILSRSIALDVAEEADKNGISVVVLPGIPLGSQNPGQTSLPFCLHATQATQYAVLQDIVSSLERCGVNKLLIVNGHGGNSFKGMIRDLAVLKPGFQIVVSNWFDFIPRKDYFEETVDDHAGEQETSVMMHYHPELVRMEYASDGASKPFAIEGLRKKVGWLPRNWAEVSADTGVGNPFRSSPEKGALYARAVVEALSKLVTDLCSNKKLY